MWGAPLALNSSFFFSHQAHQCLTFISFNSSIQKNMHPSFIIINYIHTFTHFFAGSYIVHHYTEETNKNTHTRIYGGWGVGGEGRAL